MPCVPANKGRSGPRPRPPGSARLRIPSGGGLRQTEKERTPTLTKVDLVRTTDGPRRLSNKITIYGWSKEEWWRPWREMMRGHREAGRTLRRLRFVWRDADELVKAGEEVRWLPRQRASALLLPGNDLWSFDGEKVVFTHLSGEGTIRGYELTREPALVAQCVTAFEAAWRAAIPHG